MLFRAKNRAQNVMATAAVPADLQKKKEHVGAVEIKNKKLTNVHFGKKIQVAMRLE